MPDAGDNRPTTGPPSARVLVTCGVFEPGFRGGGTIRAVAQIVDAPPEGVDLLLVTADRDLGEKAPYPGLSGTWVQRGRAKVFYLDTRSPVQWMRLLIELRKTRFDLMYANSFWAPMATGVPILLSWLRLLRCRRTIIAPRGELASGALSLKARKKRLAFRAWGNFVRMMGIRWHATAAHEAADILAHFPWARVLISADQTALPPEPLAPVRSTSEHARLVFISRIARVKNLDVVLRALQLTSSPVELDIFGPIEEPRYWAECQELISALPGHVTVSYRGPLAQSEVRGTFFRYDAFVFPTRGENFGYVIAESLSASCPVVCSSHTMWTDVLNDGGGVVLDESTPAALSGALERIVSAGRDERDRSRTAAGESYRKWRRKQSGENMISELMTHAQA